MFSAGNGGGFLIPISVAEPAGRVDRPRPFAWPSGWSELPASSVSLGMMPMTDSRPSLLAEVLATDHTCIGLSNLFSLVNKGTSE